MAASASSTTPPIQAPRAPRAARDLDDVEIGGALRVLRQHPLFWVGLAVKIVLGVSCGSHFATRWFSPFVYDFVHGHFSDPWAASLARGEPLAFPYGPGMLAILSVPWLPALVTSFDPSSHLGLVLLRLPLLASDIAVCAILMRWLRMNTREVILAYWLSPVVIYATYVHGQLDIVPTALLCIALHLLFQRRTWAGSLVFGLALATKGHLLIAAPFALVYLYRQRRPRRAWLRFLLITTATTLALYALPLSSAAFRAMVLGSSELQKIWFVSIAYGATGLVLYVAPAGLLVAFLRFASYRKVNRELTIMFMGAVYVGLVALVPPQPGWFIWSIPFVAYTGAQFTRTGRFALAALSTAYLAYFFVGDPVTFLEAFDPIVGAGAGARGAVLLGQAMPLVFGHHGASISWSLLFSATALMAYEMYRRGVRSNSIYSFRDDSFMMGIGGDSGAGKHTIARDMEVVMGAQISVVNGDDDHKWERGHAMWRRFTHLNPRGNELKAQLESLASLRRGGDVRRRHYDHDKGQFTDRLLTKPNDFMAIVGLHPFYLASQRELLHLKVFIDPEEDLRREWKIARDTAARGYTRERVLEQMDQRAADSLAYVKPQMQYADLVIRHGHTGPAPEAVNVEIVLKSELEPLSLVDALGDVASVTVTWQPDDTLTRDHVRIQGELDAEQVRILAQEVIPNIDELAELEGFSEGGRGLAQLVILHAVSVRLRGIHAGRDERN